MLDYKDLMIEGNYKLTKYWQLVDQYKIKILLRIAVYLNLFYLVKNGVVQDPTKAIMINL